MASDMEEERDDLKRMLQGILHGKGNFAGAIAFAYSEWANMYGYCDGCDEWLPHEELASGEDCSLCKECMEEPKDE
jgi:hypothetical protein